MQQGVSKKESETADEEHCRRFKAHTTNGTICGANPLGAFIKDTLGQSVRGRTEMVTEERSS
jgi:hypothetical protein